MNPYLVVMIVVAVAGLAAIGLLAYWFYQAAGWKKIVPALIGILATLGVCVILYVIGQKMATPSCPECVAIVTEAPIVIEEPVVTEAPVVVAPTLTPVPVEPTATPVPTCESVNLNLTTGGEVINNLDDGDQGMGTITLVTRDMPSVDPVLFVIMPGASLDVEYAGKMFFTTDRFNGRASVETATCLAEILHPGVVQKIVIGSEETPEGWFKFDKLFGWWTISTWLYQEEPIYPKGLTASEGIFVSAAQTERDLVTNESEVIYGQFWTESNPGYVVHIQVRQNKTLTVPQGWQGTYWIWTGDFNLGETDLQKRMLQASFIEVADRDDIKGITLLACGDMPPVGTIDGTLLFFRYLGHDITWNPWLDGWTCK